MRVGIETPHVPVILLLILARGAQPSSARTTKVRDNPLNLDFTPAPSPKDGPPFSAGALRNPAYLPAEVGGIVGAYVFVVCVIGVALLFVGRRLRISTEQSKQALDVEMISPPQIYPSPLTPRSGAHKQNFSWPSPEKTDRNPYVFPGVNVATSIRSNPSVDLRVVEADRNHLDQGLENLYAHVMAHEEAKANNNSRMASITSLPQPPLSPLSSHRQPLPATSPQRPARPVDKSSKPAGMSINVEHSKAPKSQSRASSIISSLKSPRKKAMRGMQISSPIPTPLSQSFPNQGYASDEEPLSPVHYSPPPPPPVPKDQVPYYSHSRNTSTNTMTNNVDPSPVSPTRSIGEQLSGAGNMSQHAFNQSLASLQVNSNPNNMPPPASTQPLKNSSSGAPRLPAIKTNSASNTPPASHNNSTRTLPFRAFDPPPGLSSPTFSHSTKTTVLERTTPLSPSGMKTPWSAGGVPYSPYQPMTPVTPYSPRLVTRQERKMKKKMEGRGPVVEMVEADEDVWEGGL